MWDANGWLYARCPKCYRQELTTWSMQFYSPRRSIVMMLNLGAKPLRCAACRYNFASFRKRKEKFVWRHQERPYAPPEVNPEAGVGKPGQVQ